MSETGTLQAVKHFNGFDEIDREFESSCTQLQFDSLYLLTPELSPEVDALMKTTYFPCLQDKLITGIFDIWDNCFIKVKL